MCLLSQLHIVSAIELSMTIKTTSQPCLFVFGVCPVELRMMRSGGFGGGPVEKTVSNEEVPCLPCFVLADLNVILSSHSHRLFELNYEF